MKVAFYTLGCKLNQAETESMAGRFSKAGFQIVAPDDIADIYIANTCTVTHIADRKSRHWLRMARRRNPGALIIATGCYAQRSYQDLAPIADLVLDNSEKDNLFEIVAGLLSQVSFSDTVNKPLYQLSAPLQPDNHSHYYGELKPSAKRKCREAISLTNNITRARSFIKIQDGCHGICAYCIVPKVRPHEYSIPASQIIDEVKQKVAMGYREVILTGTKVGCYRDNAPDTNEETDTGLRNLVQCILCNTDIQRLRLSSLQPSEISPKLLDLWQDERLCRHFHLALQSGSDAILESMGRRYALNDYQRTLNLIKETVPEVAITTDIIVGFPGEGDEEFEQSYSFCQQAGFANIHVFPFSARPETAADGMPCQVKDKVKQERTQRMLELSQDCRRSFYKQFLNQTMPILWEKETSHGSGIYSGLTDNYIRVFVHSGESLTNKITSAKLVGFHNQGMWGESHGSV